jgi:hypothetical protein
MKTKSLLLTVFVLYMALLATAQRGQGSLVLRLPVQYAWYTVDVTVAADQAARGPKKNQSLLCGANLSYEHFLSNRVSVEAGLGIHSAKFKIIRGYNPRYMGSLLAVLPSTHPHYRYALLQLPIRAYYRLGSTRQLDWSLGIANIFSFTYKQRYGSEGVLKRFYFFSNAVQLGAKLRYKLPGRFCIGAEPFVQVFNQWKKDEVVFDYGPGFQQPIPPGVSKYNKQPFDAVGIALLLSYKL